MVDERELKLEIDGPDSEPTAISAIAAARLFAAYLELLRKLAADADVELSFKGLVLRNKCTQLATEASDPEHARLFANAAALYVAGIDEPPPGCIGLVNEVKAARQLFSPEQTTKALMGQWEWPLTVQAKELRLPPYEITAFRARLIRIGGRTPRALFDSPSEMRPFTIAVSRASALPLAAHLYRELDIEAKILRGEADDIASGQLISFEPVSDGNPYDAWRDWHRDNASEWDAVTDLEQELDRD